MPDPVSAPPDSNGGGCLSLASGSGLIGIRDHPSAEDLKGRPAESSLHRENLLPFP